MFSIEKCGPPQIFLSKHLHWALFFHWHLFYWHSHNEGAEETLFPLHISGLAFRRIWMGICIYWLWQPIMGFIRHLCARNYEGAKVIMRSEPRFLTMDNITPVAKQVSGHSSNSWTITISTVAQLEAKKLFCGGGIRELWMWSWFSYWYDANFHTLWLWGEHYIIIIYFLFEPLLTKFYLPSMIWIQHSFKSLRNY